MEQLDNYEIIIIGGGYIGLSVAGALANNGFKCAVIEKDTFLHKQSINEPGRLLAIAYQSVKILKDFKLVDNLASIGQEISSIMVCEGNSKHHLHFNPKQIGVANFGYMVDEQILFQELYKNVKNKISLFDATENLNFYNQDHAITIGLAKKKLSAKLVIIADGKRSYHRKLAGIETFTHKYNQYAVVCDIAHQYSHQGMAIERFMSDGPFAVLPKKGGNLSSIVWTISNDLVPALKSLDKLQIQELVKDRVGTELGNIEIVSDIKFFPLELVLAKQYFSKRQVLLGDALHSIHPLAGQGLNLSLRDLQCLCDLLVKYRSLGIDIGSDAIFEEYQKQRLLDNNLMIESTHNLNFLFSNNLMAVKFLRQHGLSFINRSPSLKNMFMKYACGI